MTDAKCPQFPLAEPEAHIGAVTSGIVGPMGARSNLCGCLGGPLGFHSHLQCIAGVDNVLKRC